MNKLCSALKSVLGLEGTIIDNYVFRMHYKVTVFILIVLSITVGWRQHFGRPISCMSNVGISDYIVDGYCYTHSTFTIDEAWNKSVESEVPYPGIQRQTTGLQRTYYTYYQWVSIVLFLQTIPFYLPKLLWTIFESGRVKEMMGNLYQHNNEESKRNYLELLAEDLLGNLKHNGIYFMFYSATELLNVVNIFVQMSLMDSFLGGAFWTYGLQAIKLFANEWTELYDPMSRVFPEVALCTFRKYGASGTVTRYEVSCFLNINVLNQKIYLFLWFWFVFLAVLSCFALVYRLLIFLSPKIRFRVLKLGAMRLDKQDHLKIVLSQCNAGDWFMIRLLSKNLNSANFKDLVSILALKFKRDNSFKLQVIPTD